jgi:hypothetical protein
MASSAGVTIYGQDASQGLARVGFFCAGDEFWRALRHDSAAAFAAFGTEIDDPVGLLDDIEMMLDDQHGVAKGNQTLEHVQEFANIVEVQSGRWFVENVKSAAGLPL